MFFRLDPNRFGNIAMLQFIYSNITMGYNLVSPGHHLTFATPKQQIELSAKVAKRLKLINLFDEPSVIFHETELNSVPDTKNQAWGRFTLSELEENRDNVTPIRIPYLDPSDEYA